MVTFINYNFNRLIINKYHKIIIIYWYLPTSIKNGKCKWYSYSLLSSIIKKY